MRQIRKIEMWAYYSGIVVWCMMWIMSVIHLFITFVKEVIL